MHAASHDDEAIAAYYALGLERDRLSAGQGALELVRTRILLERYLPAPPAVVADVGGGPGRHNNLVRIGRHGGLLKGIRGGVVVRCYHTYR